MKKYFALIFVLILSGCATVNFSSKYYTLPKDYQSDIQNIWDELVKKVSLKNSYSYTISEDKETQMAGIPQISGQVVYLPRYYLQYVYDFYYNDRASILTFTIAHEIAHTEFDLSSGSPKHHYLTDKAAIEKILLANTAYTPSDFYSSLKVLSDYWAARKGAGGHMVNIGWNALNVASACLGGPFALGDLFATDLSTRLKLLKKDYPKAKFAYIRLK